jgi:uncharacterized protein YndB with AHSA1/START domain
MARSNFVYVTYIRTSAQQLWTALTSPEFQRQYWFGVHLESDWKQGSSWKMLYDDGRLTDSGEVIESDPPRRLVLRWRNEFRPELKEEGYSRCTITIEPVEEAMKLTVLHEMERPDSKLIDAVGGGWPKILSNLKSLLETGRVAMSIKP